MIHPFQAKCNCVYPSSHTVLIDGNQQSIKTIACRSILQAPLRFSCRYYYNTSGATDFRFQRSRAVLPSVRSFDFRSTSYKRSDNTRHSFGYNVIQPWTINLRSLSIRASCETILSLSVVDHNSQQAYIWNSQLNLSFFHSYTINCFGTKQIQQLLVKEPQCIFQLGSLLDDLTSSECNHS